jgi:hypothetical protein
MQPFGQNVTTTTKDLQTLQSAINSYNLERMSSVCKGNLSSYNATIGQMHSSLAQLSSTIKSAERLTACSNISPIFHALVDGLPCSKSIRSLSCMLGTTCGMLILGLIMLCTRAALYNPIISPRRLKRREREFKEYVEYMKTFYDTDDWKLDSQVNKEKGESIQLAPTFETVGSDEPSPSRSDENDSSKDSDGINTQDGLENNLRATKRTSNSLNLSTLSKNRHTRPFSNLTRESLPLPNELEDPDVEYYSSDSEDDESVGAKTNISALVSRFFVVQRGPDNDSSFSTEGDLNTSSRSLKSLLGPASHFFTPIRKKNAFKSELKQGDSPFDESLNLSDESPLPLQVEPLSLNRTSGRKNMAPQKQHRSMLRTHGAAKLSIPRTDVV